MARRVFRRARRTVRRAMRRFKRVPRGIKLKKSNFPPVYRYKQIVTGSDMNYLNVNSSVGGTDTIQQSTSTTTAIVFTPVAEDIPQWSTFAALYDQYKISFVAIRMFPQVVQTISPSASTSPSSGGTCVSVLDYDDATLLPSLLAAMEYDNAKFHNVLGGLEMKPIKRVFKPHLGVVMTTATGSNVTAYNRKAGWIDCAQNTIPHYGCKMWIDEAAAGTHIQQIWRVWGTYYVQFKNVR